MGNKKARHQHKVQLKATRRAIALKLATAQVGPGVRAEDLTVLGHSRVAIMQAVRAQQVAIIVSRANQKRAALHALRGPVPTPAPEPRFDARDDLWETKTAQEIVEDIREFGVPLVIRDDGPSFGTPTTREELGDELADKLIAQSKAGMHYDDCDCSACDGSLDVEIECDE